MLCAHLSVEDVDLESDETSPVDPMTEYIPEVMTRSWEEDMVLPVPLRSYHPTNPEDFDNCLVMGLMGLQETLQFPVGLHFPVELRLRGELLDELDQESGEEKDLKWVRHKRHVHHPIGKSSMARSLFHDS